MGQQPLLMDFKLTSDYKPRGDQGKAIEQLARGVRDAEKHQVLLGVTGSGKTYTTASTPLLYGNTLQRGDFPALYGARSSRISDVCASTVETQRAASLPDGGEIF